MSFREGVSLAPAPFAHYRKRILDYDILFFEIFFIEF